MTPFLQDKKDPFFVLQKYIYFFKLPGFEVKSLVRHLPAED